MIQMQCQYCGKKLKIASQYAGKKGKCPGCHQVIEVPIVTLINGNSDKEQEPVKPSAASFNGTYTMVEKTKDCPYCGEEILEKAVKCKFCGEFLDTRPAAHPSPVYASPPPGYQYERRRVTGSKNKYVAALLAFFLGGLGFHKFYLGKIGWGILYLLFCWTGLPALFALIEALIYLCMSEESFYDTYG